MTFDIKNIGEIAARHNAAAMAENGNSVNSGKPTSANGSNPKDKAKYWFNIGAVALIEGEQQFVSMGGFPLDAVPQNVFGAFGKKKAELRAKFLEAAAKLAPGGTKHIPAGPFVIELRHVSDEVAVQSTEKSAEFSIFDELLG